MLIRITTFLLVVTRPIYPHGKEGHNKKVTDEVDSNSKVQVYRPEQQQDSRFVEINEYYQKNVKNIFKKSCYNCHTDKTEYPWYFSLPGIKQVIENDIKEAKSHLFLTETFPFRSHSTPLNDLEEIWNSIEADEMPPFEYRIMHPDSKLNSDEKAIIKKWIDETKKRLKCDLPC